MVQALPDASEQNQGNGSGFSAAYGARLAAYGSIELGGNAIVTPGDGNNYTVNPGEFLVLANTNDSTATITLSDALAAADGAMVVVKDSGGNAGTNNITITAETDASHDIDGSNQDLTLNTNFGDERLIADGTDFWTF